jgi:hypothetical protein
MTLLPLFDVCFEELKGGGRVLIVIEGSQQQHQPGDQKGRKREERIRQAFWIL